MAGLAIGIVDGDKTTLLGYGRVTDDSPRKPEGDTVYEIGSITKAFTGILLADSIVNKKVALDNLVAKLLPDTVKMPSKAINLSPCST